MFIPGIVVVIDGKGKAVEDEELVGTEPSMRNETLNYETPLIDILNVTEERRNIFLPKNMVAELSPMTLITTSSIV